MALIETATHRRAVENVSTWGDTDVFPFPIENHVLHDRRDQVVALLAEVATDFNRWINTYPVVSYSALAPVGYVGFRWATQIDPLWNSYLLSLVLSLAPAIESSRLPEESRKVFSYRFRADSSSGIFAEEGWRLFQETSRTLAEDHGYVVAVDIADFYARIYHHRLENALRRLDPGATRTMQIMDLLARLSNNTSYGLPVGGPAARLLAELVLNSVDHLLVTEPVARAFCRYADDYRFFVNDMQSAYRVLGYLSEKLLRNEGLTLQKGKTRIMSSAEYLSTLDPPHPPAGSAARFLGLHIHYDPYSTTADEDYETLKAQLDEFDIVGLLRTELAKGRVHASLTRRLVNALRYMDLLPRQQAIISLLENVETLAPVMPQVMRAVRDLTDDGDDEAATIVQSRVRELIDLGHYIAQTDVNLAFMVRVLMSRRTPDNEQMLARLFNRAHGFGAGPAPNIQRDIVLAMARWGVSYWLSDQKNYVAGFHPWVKRAFLIGSYTLGDEGRYWRESVRDALNPFDVIVRDWASEKVQQVGWQVPV